MHYLSIFKYGIEGFIEIEFNSDDTYECSELQLINSNDPENCSVSANEVRNALNTDGLSPVAYAFILIGFAIMYRLLLTVVLKLKGTSRS